MYWAIAAFNFIVALSAVAMVLGQSPNAYSEPMTLICSTIIACISLILMTVSVVLLQNSHRRKTLDLAMQARTWFRRAGRAGGNMLVSIKWSADTCNKKTNFYCNSKRRHLQWAKRGSACRR
jgi:low affinity Fe/Cu permease